MNARALSIGVAAALTIGPAGAWGSLDNKGDDFILAFMPNDIVLDDPVAEVHLTSEVATNVTVQYPVNGPLIVDTTVPVNPGTITILSLPLSAANGWVADVVDNNAVRAFADDEFVAYMINRDVFTSDAALALPIDTHNTEYIVADYTPLVLGSQFVVYAAFDNTTVTITPTADLVGGHSAGVPYDVGLNAGEGYYGRSVSTGAAGIITGTIISSDNPVGLTNGSYCVNVPAGTAACDHIFEVAQPVQTWGDTVLVANLPQRPEGTYYRILASVDATQVAQDGVNVGPLLDRGEYLELGPLPGDHLFTANEPVFVCQYMSGDNAQGAVDGDPAQGNMIPAAQYLSDYTFATVGGGQFLTNYVTIIAESAAVGTMTLDAAVIPAGDFLPIGVSGFWVARIQLDSGTHTTSSPGAVHGITVEGYNPFNSYIYPGGALFQFINPVGDENPPLCSCDVISGTPPVADCIAQDDRPSEDVNGNGVLDPGEDLNGNGLIDEDTGIFFVELAPGSMNLTLFVDPFIPGDGIVAFTVELTDPSLDGSGTVVVTDGAGNTCEVDVMLTPQLDAFLDIKPGSCPNSFNRRSNGVLPVALLGTEDFDVMEVDLASLLLSRVDGMGGSIAPLNGPPGPGFSYDDVATPFDGELCDCHELMGDGWMDLLMKFRTPDVASALELSELEPGMMMQLKVTGTLLDGTPFEAADCVRFVPPQQPRGARATGGMIKTGR